MIEKTKDMKKFYEEAEPDYVKSKSFKMLLETSNEKMKINPSSSIICFKTVFDELRSRKVKDVYLTKNQELYVAKLRKTMRLLDKAIRKLETQEVDFEDDDDSSYIILDCYQKRFNCVYKKYCEYMREDPYATRMTHRKLDFNASKHVEINRAIDRLFLKEKKFPVYHEVEECVQNCIRDENLNIPKSAVARECTY